MKTNGKHFYRLHNQLGLLPSFKKKVVYGTILMICYQFYRFFVQRMGTFLSLDLLSTRWMRRWDARRQRLAEFVFCGISVRRTDDIEMENPVDEEVWRKSVSCMPRWNRFLQALTWAGANSGLKKVLTRSLKDEVQSGSDAVKILFTHF